MNSEVADSIKIIKVINRHLRETDCHHNIKSIISEALNENAGSQPQQQTQTQTTAAATLRTSQNGNYRNK